MDKIDFVKDRTADSRVRFEVERALDRALIDLEVSRRSLAINDIAFITTVKLSGTVHNCNLVII